jgi:hypothetical protein
MDACDIFQFRSVLNYGTEQPMQEVDGCDKQMHKAVTTLINAENPPSKYASVAGLPCKPEKIIGTTARTFGSLCANFYFHHAMQLLPLCRKRYIFFLHPLFKNSKNVRYKLQ